MLTAIIKNIFELCSCLREYDMDLQPPANQDKVYMNGFPVVINKYLLQ